LKLAKDVKSKVDSGHLLLPRNYCLDVFIDKKPKYKARLVDVKPWKFDKIDYEWAASFKPSALLFDWDYLHTKEDQDIEYRTVDNKSMMGASTEEAQQMPSDFQNLAEFMDFIKECKTDSGEDPLAVDDPNASPKPNDEVEE